MFEFGFYQNSLTLLFLIISFIVVFILGCKKKSDIKIISGLFLWHTAFSIFYFLFTLMNAADALNYYKMSLSNNIVFYPGSPFIYFFSSIFSSKIFGANYLNVTLIYNLFGVIGLVYLYLSLKRYLKNMPIYWFLVLFIPSMSFWSSGLGKDSISFFAVSLFLYTITTNRKAHTKRKDLK